MTALDSTQTVSLYRKPSRWLVIVLFLLTLTGPLVIGWLIWLGCEPFSTSDASTRLFAGLPAGLAFALLGSFIFLYQTHNRIGWLSLGIAFCLPGSIALDLYVQCGLAGTMSAPGRTVVAWLLYSYGVFPVIPLVILLPMIYPTGQFLSPYWRRVAIIGLLILAIAGTGAGLNPDFSQVGFMYFFPLENPFGLASLPSWWSATLDIINELSFAGLRLIAIAAIIARFRQSKGDERQQMKWLVYYIGLVFGVTVLFFNLPANLLGLPTLKTVWFSLIVTVSFIGIPIVIGIAIFKYRLYAIDIIINRTLVYGGLTLLITVVYVFLVGGISTVTANQSGQVIGLVLATGIVAVGVRPLHRSLQATADRVIAVPDLPPVGEPMNEPTMKMTDPARPRPFIRWIALVIWALIVLAHLTLFVFDLNVDFAQVLVPCTGGLDGGCNFLAISEAEMAALTVWGLTPRAYALAMNLVPIIVLLVYWLLGGLILWRQGMSWFGLALSLALIVTPVMAYSTDTDWTLVNPNLVPLGAIVVFLGTVIMLLFLYLIPNGRFSPRWAYIPMICTLLLIGGAPLEISRIVAPPAQVEPLINITTISLVLLGGGLHIYRYLRDSTPIERQQTKWILFGILSFIVAVIIWVIVFGRAVAIPDGEPRLLANFAGWLLTGLFLLGLPVAITLAILRYKLWDIDVIINRTLVYGGLTLVVVLIYILTVGGLGLLFQTSGNFVISLLATALIAIAFQPVRERLQRGVNRFMFGQRDDPYAVLSHLSQQLQTTAVPTETLTSIVETIAATLKLPYAAIELIEQETQVGQAAVGEPLGETVELPLRYQKETVGRLLVSPRAPDEKFTIKEQQLLADIAAQTGPVASATRLTLALQRSREKLVLAREEERRRIRRDLHDGLGPTLASQTLKLDIVLDMLTSDPSAAGQHVTQLKAQTQQMVADIRRLVYELRPPALDELGLLEALRSHVAQMSGTNGRLSISIDATPEPLPPLPAAIEVAAYRIALEGVTNVIRHAQANRCHVRFAITEEQPLPSLVITITDNGRGLPGQFQSGVGLTSMRERAEELGGVCTVGAAHNQGTRVRAVLPFSTNGAGR